MMIVDKDGFTMPGKDRPPQSFLDLRTQQGQINWLAQFLMSVNAAFDDLEVTATIETGEEMSVTTEYDEETKTLTFHFVFTGGGGGGYVLPTMSADVKGGAKVGSGLAMTGEALGLEGVSFTQEEKTKLAGVDEGANDYVLPTMGAAVKGGAMVGSGLAIADDVLNVDASSVASGTLPVERGGTGVSSLSSARARFGSVPFGTCTTQNGSYPKVVTNTGFDSQNPPYAGARIAVMFANTSQGGGDYFKLSLGNNSYNVWSNGAALSSSNPLSISAGAIAEFIFDGTQFHYLGNDIDGYQDYDANQAIADNAAAIATLQESVSHVKQIHYSIINGQSNETINLPSVQSIYVFALGLWSHSALALVFPKQNTAPQVTVLGTVGGSTSMMFGITGTGTAITVANNNSYNEPMLVIQLVK